MTKMFFISGVNGVGKTSIMPYLKELLPGNEFEIHDFDERGVPENAGGSWRISETKYWVVEGVKLSGQNKSIIICGFVKPADFEDMLNNEDLGISLILLDAQPEIIKQRLINRYSVAGYFDESQTVIGKQINVFIDGNLYILSQMKKKV
jgi:gluconate kinase